MHDLVTFMYVAYHIQNMDTYSYTPSGDQPIGEQEMKIRGVH